MSCLTNLFFYNWNHNLLMRTINKAWKYHLASLYHFVSLYHHVSLITLLLMHHYLSCPCITLLSMYHLAAYPSLNSPGKIFPYIVISLSLYHLTVHVSPCCPYIPVLLPIYHFTLTVPSCCPCFLAALYHIDAIASLHFPCIILMPLYHFTALV